MSGGGGIEFVVVGVGVFNAEDVFVDEANCVAADFIGLAIGVKLAVDIGPFGPFPEELFEFLLGFVAEEFEAGFFELETAGKQVTAAEGNDGGDEVAELAEFGSGVFGRGGVVGGGGEAEFDPVDEVFDQGQGLGEVGVIGRGVGEEFKGLLAEFKFGEGAFAELVEVFLGDRGAGEMFLEDGLDFGAGVEPGEEWSSGFVVGQALDELGPEVGWETGDFAEHKDSQ